ncbi:MAG TPA: ABC transporter permease [Polyangiaceae bacterium]|jgi:ABC-type multidrug transport system permease subunit
MSKTEEDVPRPLAELVKARVREFLREPGYVFWVFGFPLLMAIGLGLAFRSKSPAPPQIAVTSALEPKLAQSLLGSKRVAAQVLDRAQGTRALARTKIDLLVDQDGPGQPPILHFDASQEKALLARAITSDVLERAAGARDPLTLHEQTVSDKGARYIDFLLPGLIGLNLMGSSMWGIGFNLVLARKRKLLRRYAVTPMRRSHFLLSYFFSRSLFLVLELTLLVAFGRVAFGTLIQGSLASLIVAACFGAAAFAALGLMIGARLDSTEVANGWMNFVQLPMWLLSGSFFSYERFPQWLKLPIRLLPLTAVNDALRGIYNDAAPLSALSFELSVLGAWSVLGFALAIRTFRWQ